MTTGRLCCSAGAAYYASLEDTGFTPATADEAPKTGKYSSKLSGIEKVPLDTYPYMVEEKKRHPNS